MRTEARLFDEFVEGGADRIQRAVQDSEAESLHLDFKQVANPKLGVLGTDDQRNLGRALSGFGNADGGVLVWGVGEKNTDHRNPQHKALDLIPIFDIKRFVDSLNSHVASVVQPVLDGVMNHGIELPDGTGFAVTLVPQSARKPHMCVAKEDRRYYIRMGSQTLSVEHWFVETLMRSRCSPEIQLVISEANLERTPDGPTMAQMRSFLSLSVVGSVPARDVVVSLASYHDRRYRGQLDLASGSIVRAKFGASEPRHALQFRTPPNVTLYPGTTYENIEVIQPCYGQAGEHDVIWEIHADGFYSTGVLTIPVKKFLA